MKYLNISKCEGIVTSVLSCFCMKGSMYLYNLNLSGIFLRLFNTALKKVFLSGERGEMGGKVVLNK